eukprot:5917546-Pyramimonas_sp.AAC.1
MVLANSNNDYDYERAAAAERNCSNVGEFDRSQQDNRPKKFCQGWAPRAGQRALHAELEDEQQERPA